MNGSRDKYAHFILSIICNIIVVPQMIDKSPLEIFPLLNYVEHDKSRVLFYFQHEDKNLLTKPNYSFLTYQVCQIHSLKIINDVLRNEAKRFLVDYIKKNKLADDDVRLIFKRIRKFKKILQDESPVFVSKKK